MSIKINNNELAGYAGSLTMIYAMRFAGPQPEQVKGYIASVVPHEYIDDVYIVTFQTSDADPGKNGQIVTFSTANTRFYLNGFLPLGGGRKSGSKRRRITRKITSAKRTSAKRKRVGNKSSTRNRRRHGHRH
jgi:hypothetical protein